MLRKKISQSTQALKLWVSEVFRLEDEQNFKWGFNFVVKRRIKIISGELKYKISTTNCKIVPMVSFFTMFHFRIVMKLYFSLDINLIVHIIEVQEPEIVSLRKFVSLYCFHKYLTLLKKSNLFRIWNFYHLRGKIFPYQVSVVGIALSLFFNFFTWVRNWILYNL